MDDALSVEVPEHEGVPATAAEIEAARMCRSTATGTRYFLAAERAAVPQRERVRLADTDPENGERAQALDDQHRAGDQAGRSTDER